MPRDMSGPTVVAGTASKQDVMKAYAISEEEYDEIKRDFDEMDADKSGFVDGAEIAVSLKKERGGQAQSDEEVAAALKTFDSDADGKITFLEYVGALGYQPIREKAAASAATVNAAMRAPLEWVFEQLDDDGSGFIEEREGLKVGKWLGGGGGDLLAFWTKMKADMDTDGDGKISKEEFVTWMGTKGCLHPTAALQLKDEVQSKLNQAKLQQPYPKRLIPSLSAIAGKDGITPTFFTCQENKPDCLKLLIAKKADLNKPNLMDGGSPLYIACSKNNADCVRLLLEAGADVNLPRKDGSTCLQAALKKKNLVVAKLCIQYGAEIDRKLPPSNKTPFQMAMEIVYEKDVETRKEYLMGMYEPGNLCGLLCDMLKEDNRKLRRRIAAREAGGEPPETDRREGDATETQMNSGEATDRSVVGRSPKKEESKKKKGGKKKAKE